MLRERQLDKVLTAGVETVYAAASGRSAQPQRHTRARATERGPGEISQTVAREPDWTEEQ